MKFEFDWPSSFRGEDVSIRWWTTDRWTNKLVAGKSMVTSVLGVSNSGPYFRGIVLSVLM